MSNSAWIRGKKMNKVVSLTEERETQRKDKAIQLYLAQLSWCFYVNKVPPLLHSASLNDRSLKCYLFYGNQ